MLTNVVMVVDLFHFETKKVSQKVTESIQKVVKCERKLFRQFGYNIFAICSVLVQVWFTASKMEPDILYGKLCIEAATQAAKYLKN